MIFSRYPQSPQPSRAAKSRSSAGRSAALAACALALAAAVVRVEAQVDKLTPAQQCDFLASVRIGPERGTPGSPLPYELAGQLAQVRSACEQAVKDQPKAARLHAKLARVRALAGDARGALEAARTGAELGSPMAQVLLGVMFAQGLGVPRDYAAAREQFRRAAKEGEPHAHFNLGLLFANGWGVEADDTNAAASFRQAALGGDAIAMQLLGQIYDKSQAEQWWKKAAEAMYPEGKGPLRIAPPGRAEPDAAALLAWYEQKARGAEPWAQAYMGALYETGVWLRQDFGAAADLYRKAGEAGNFAAQMRMAAFYREGRGVPRDPVEARRWGLLFQVQRCEALERAEPGANACDRLAADRYDPHKVLPGVDSFCLRQFAPKAVAACAQASKASPATVRYRAQLARALAHTGNFEAARREALAAAAAGSTPAMILLGVMSQRGLGTALNEADALAWYRKAAGLGDARGVSLVISSAYSGVGVAKDSAEAKSLLQDMRNRPVSAAPSRGSEAERGDPSAQFNLAAQFERDKNYAEAIKWYTRAADRGFEAAALNLAQMYEKGIGVKADTAEAMKRYRVLAAQGDGEARYRLAKLAANAGNFAEAVKLYRQGIENDDIRAMLDLGQMYEAGRGVPKDARLAAGLYERAAERSRWARVRLGAMYLQGDGIAKDYAKALHWLRRAAGDGHAGARNNLGFMLDRGLGAGADYVAARDLYLAALGSGNREAKGNLENFYAEGRGAPSGAAALEWYRAGADAEIAAAQYRLGRLYAKGEGVPRDDRAALLWFARAAQQGHREARKEAAELYFASGQHAEAAALGHEGAARALAGQMINAGQPGAAAEWLRRFEAERRAFPPAPVWPQGIAPDPGEDQQRTIAVRIAGVGETHVAAMDAGIANIYDVVYWFPETDGKAKPK